MKKTCACACVHKQNKTNSFTRSRVYIYQSMKERQQRLRQERKSVCERVKTDLFFGYVCMYVYVCDGDSQAVDMIAARKKKHAY